MHNHVTLLGNVGGTITVRESGDSRYARFQLATDRFWRDPDGNRHEATDWHLCTLFGATLDTFAERVGNGSLLFIEGSLRTRRYEKDGEARYITEVRIRRWRVISQGNGQRSQRPADDGASEPLHEPDLDAEPLELDESDALPATG